MCLFSSVAPLVKGRTVVEISTRKRKRADIADITDSNLAELQHKSYGCGLGEGRLLDGRRGYIHHQWKLEEMAIALHRSTAITRLKVSCCW